VNITFIGGGNMADALLGGLLGRGFAPASLRVVEIDATARERIERKYPGLKTFSSAQDALRPGDIVVFAVKPQQMFNAVRASGLSQNANLVISIAAGVTLTSMSRWLMGHQRMIRVMPNTPSLIGQGVAGLIKAPGVSDDDVRSAETIVGAVGKSVWVRNDADIDTVTAISGSGPAYVFWFIEQLAKSGEALGLPAGTAKTLAIETVLGAAKLAAQSSEPPSVLRERVTSKGGTTAAALKVFDESGMAESFQRAVEAAKRRGAEMGDEMGKD
jgi:pyrroline-5-carboxylate reductase